MNRLAFGVEYDGSLLHGWQKQIDQPRTVQEILEKAISFVADEPIKTICAGRTDAGVHAVNQVVHVDTKANRDNRAWIMGCNTILPEDVRILWVKPISSEFNARRSALSRHYRYCIYNHQVRPSLFRKQLTWFHRPLSVDKMQEAAEHWLGEQDFSSFRAAGCQSKSPVRKVTHVQVRRLGDLVIFDIIANAFLHHMVRNMVGVLLDVGQGKVLPIHAKHVLEAKDRTQAGVTAPPNGLYLVGVQYPSEYDINEASCLNHSVLKGISNELV